MRSRRGRSTNLAIQHGFFYEKNLNLIRQGILDLTCDIDPVSILRSKIDALYHVKFNY